jgi:hypothetical protein
MSFLSFLNTRNVGAERLIGFGSLGNWFALILGHNGKLSTIPLAIGTGLSLIGFGFKIANRRKKEGAL